MSLFSLVEINILNSVLYSYMVVLKLLLCLSEENVPALVKTHVSCAAADGKEEDDLWHGVML